jgi:hypothetical protein
MISAQTRSAFVAMENRYPLFRIMLYAHFSGGAWNYNNFTNVNSFCKQRRGCIHRGGNRVQSSQDLARWRLGELRIYRRRHRRRTAKEITMLRKFSLVAVAAASLGVAALAPTSASAWGGGGWHGGWHGGGWGWGRHVYVGGPAYYNYGYGGCYVRQLVPTPWGPRWRLVNRCY